MLTFICNTCGTKYDAHVTYGDGVQYDHDGERVKLESDQNDCDTCKKEIETEVAKAQALARQKVKERKTYGSQKNI